MTSQADLDFLREQLSRTGGESIPVPIDKPDDNTFEDGTSLEDLNFLREQQDLPMPTIQEDFADIKSGIEPSGLDRIRNFEQETIKPTFEAVGQFVGTKPLVEESIKATSGEDFSPTELVGGALSTALTLFPAASIGKIGKIIPKIPALGGLIRSATIGATIGGSEALKEGEDVSQGLKTGAITGGVLSGGIKILGAVTNKIPRSLTNRLLRLSKNEIKAATKAGRETVSEKFLNEKRFGTIDDLYQESQSTVKTIGKEVANILGNSTKKISNSVVANNVAQSEFAKNAQLTSNEILELVQKKVPETKKFLQKATIGVKDGNKVRQLVDETVGDRGWLNANPDKLEQKILKAFANEYRTTVKASEPKTVKLFDDLSDEIKIREALLDNLARGERGTMTLAKMFGLIGGGTIGAVGGAAGTALGIATAAALETPQGQQGLAIALNELNKAGIKATPAITNAIIKAIQSFTGKDQIELPQ